MRIPAQGILLARTGYLYHAADTLDTLDAMDRQPSTVFAGWTACRTPDAENQDNAGTGPNATVTVRITSRKCEKPTPRMRIAKDISRRKIVLKCYKGHDLQRKTSAKDSGRYLF